MWSRLPCPNLSPIQRNAPMTRVPVAARLKSKVKMNMSLAIGRRRSGQQFFQSTISEKSGRLLHWQQWQACLGTAFSYVDLDTPHLDLLFSPLTANSYFPAIGTIADAFNTSVELINITVTVYMVIQGICT